MFGKQITITGKIKLVSQDAESFGEALAGKKVPMKPIIILNRRDGSQAVCLFQIHEDAPPWMLQLSGGDEVTVEGKASQLPDGSLQLSDCRLVNRPR